MSMTILGHKTKCIHLALVSVLILFTTACGPISLFEKPIEDLSPEEAAERAARDARDKAWEDRNRSGIDDDSTDEFIFKKTGPNMGGGLGSLFIDKGNGAGETEFIDGIGVNSYLWRATLDTVSFMPLSSADPFGGVILTDWHANPDAPGERFKLNIRILGRALRADGITVSTFRQIQDGTGGWINGRIPSATNEKIENAILSRARELRQRAIRSR
jgi:hypothetical protein